ncbi:MAG: hypothetical protein Q9164_006195 [Protoblastenia rupestris]
MVPITEQLALSAILLIFSLLPTLVKSYDCGRLESIDRRCPKVSGPMASYPNCAVTKYSVSAFIQCADVKGPDTPFQSVQGGVLKILTDALNTVPCSFCPLAENIRKAADGKGLLGNFAKYLCGQSHPLDEGICCLRQCLDGVQQEHSIEAFCDGRNSDLMNAPLVPQNCISNRIVDDTTDDGDAASDSRTDTGSGVSVSGNSDSGSSGSGTGTGSSNTDTGSDDSSAPTSSISSTISTPSPEAAGGTTSTSSSPPQEAEGTTSVGSDSGKRVTYMDWVKILGFAVLPIIAAL